MNMPVNPLTNKRWGYLSYGSDFAMQPGDFGNGNLNSDLSNIVSVVKEDMNTLGISFNSIEEYEQPSKGAYKVALFIKVGIIGESNDYHWYVQNSDGYWSHKMGNLPVTRVDNSGKTIINPRLSNTGNYKFIGFYEVKK